jgi:carboxypeptidase Ss1
MLCLANYLSPLTLPEFSMHAFANACTTPPDVLDVETNVTSSASQKAKSPIRQFSPTQNFLDEAREIEDQIISIRRRIHQNPELAFRENRTAALVSEELGRLGIRVRTNVGGTGVVGVLEGEAPGRVVGLRADMDALPIEEPPGLEFRSRTDGVMHACGHDGHVAMLLGAATILAHHRTELQGTVKFLFQPAEEAAESGGGALPMIHDGAMREPRVDYVFGLHIFTNYPSRTFALREGPLMAASGTFKVGIIGKGGHGSAPHQTVDPIFIAAQVISSLQGIRSRMVDPVEPCVVSICSIHSGTRNNIIPDDAVLEGTVRTINEATRKKVVALVPQIVKSICGTFGARCEVELKEAYPVTVNDPDVTRTVIELLSSIPESKTLVVPPILTAEDFSFFLRETPGTYCFLGTRNKEKGCIYPNHSSRFRIDEDVLKYGSASLALLADRFSRQRGHSVQNSKRSWGPRKQPP